MAEAVRDFDLYWFEDILTPDRLEEQAALKEFVHPINIAGGEHEFTRFGFAHIAKEDALDIWQPDLTWCGGVTEALRILDIAREYDVSVVPHRGGEIWGLHFISATDSDNLAETHPARWEEPRDELWLDEPRVVDGHLTPLDRPGFGVILNESML
jgi:L-rhamnonate dehydratase